MAYYTGYVSVPHSTYNEWRNATLGNFYNVDNLYGSQCWDLASLFWWNIGFPQNYPVLIGLDAYTMWNRRNENASYSGVTYFDLITNVAEIKRGDIIVFNYTSYNTAGHVGFADIDYASWVPDPNQPYEFPILSENNGGTVDPQGGSSTNIHGYDIRLFLGVFRYKAWETIPPGPTPTVTRSQFPWFLIARKLRNRRI